MILGMSKQISSRTVKPRDSSYPREQLKLLSTVLKLPTEAGLIGSYFVREDIYCCGGGSFYA